MVLPALSLGFQCSIMKEKPAYQVCCELASPTIRKSYRRVSCLADMLVLCVARSPCIMPSSR